MGTSFAQDSRVWYWLQLVCLITPLPLHGFQSNLVSLESCFQGESNAVYYEGRGSFLMENVGNYRNCATFIKLSILVTMKSGILLSGCFPLRLGRSPSTLHRWIWSLVWIQGRNMGLVSRILKVWHVCMLEWTCKVVYYVGEAGKRRILMGYYFPGVIVAGFSYIPCVWLYVQQLLFFGFYIRNPPISLLSVHRVISYEWPAQV